MTRTERSTFKNAVIRDRSESKNGFDKSDRKGGSGAHNWGSLTDEHGLEYSAGLDNMEGDTEEQTVLAEAVADTMRAQTDGSLNTSTERPLSMGISEEERQRAREFRAKALKQGADLNAIARSSAGASTSPGSATVTVTTDAQTGVVP